MSEYIVCPYCHRPLSQSEYVKVIRCRDCIYYKRDPEPIDPGWPMYCERTGDDMIAPFEFCSSAIRRES